MKFCWTTLTVADMERSLAFYRDTLGIPLDRRYPAGPGIEIAFLGAGETKLELICRAGEGDIRVGEHISVGFEVESADEAMRQLAAKGIAVHSGPFQPNEHIRFFFVLDPDGLRVQLVENIA